MNGDKPLNSDIEKNQYLHLFLSFFFEIFDYILNKALETSRFALLYM